MRNSNTLRTILLALALNAPVAGQADVIGVYFDTAAEADEMISVDGVTFDAYFMLISDDIEFVSAVGFAYALTVTAGEAAHYTRLTEFLLPVADDYNFNDSDNPWSGHYLFVFETPIPVVGGSAILVSWEVILSGDIEVSIRLGESESIGSPVVIDEADVEHFLSAALGSWDLPVARIIGVADPTPIVASSFGELKCIFR